ncbi:MAG: glycerol-3-phosphate dehydrogenase [Desulfitibacter sp. BRH_c19]|nr:MAG: glycerol-3-phosphate dehydrogenase [Desulfitibacter sp. BRH_c19]
MINVAVLGSGSWGTALSLVLSDSKHNVTLWGREDEIANIYKDDRENKAYLPGVKLPNTIKFTSDIDKALARAELIVLSVPSQAVREVCCNIRPYIKGNPVIVNTAKGIEIKTLSRLSQVIKEELPLHSDNIAVLSGPSHAEEVGCRIPTAIVSASENKGIAEYVQDAFMTPYFRVYTNPDIIGVEMAGSLKNVIAVATGISDGLGFGDNSKAALITRGLSEIARLGSKMGGELLTFAGLSGVGDLVVTCTSMHSRNRRAGIQLGQGKPLEQILKDMGMVVEGIKTTKAAFDMAKLNQVEVPITEELYKILFEGLDPKLGVASLMERNKTHEVEEIVLNRKDW